MINGEELWNNRGYTYKIACTRAVNQPRMLKGYRKNAMAICYGPEVWYKNNPIFHFISFNENLKNREKEMQKIIE